MQLIKKRKETIGNPVVRKARKTNIQRPWGSRIENSQKFEGGLGRV